jgi:hypothetical protein
VQPRNRTDSDLIATAASANTSTETVTSEHTPNENDEVKHSEISTNLSAEDGHF